MSKWRNQPNWDKGERNFAAEASNLILPLTMSELYSLYTVVVREQQKSQNPTRDAELNAVMQAIDNKSGIDKSRLLRIKGGYRSSMAAEAHPKDGNTDIHRKRV